MYGGVHTQGSTKDSDTRRRDTRDASAGYETTGVRGFVILWIEVLSFSVHYHRLILQ